MRRWCRILNAFAIIPVLVGGFQHLRLLRSACGYRKSLFGRRQSTLFSTQSAIETATGLRTFNGTVTILERGKDYLVVAKPPSVLCHHSDWAGSRSKQKLKDQPEIPMLQRVRNAIGERVNVVHRLDRGASGCLLFTYSNSELNATAILSAALADESSIKTYVAIVRGEGILHERDFKEDGWFEVSRPIKNERGNINNATTFFRFLAGQDSITQPGRPRASLVLARPITGKWHQIRRHLNGLSHPILGDSSHGNSKTNKEWRDQRGMPTERTCLHLSRLQMAPTPACPDGIDISCPLPEDMMKLLNTHLPGVLREAAPLLEEEGIGVMKADDQHVTVLPYEVHLKN